MSPCCPATLSPIAATFLAQLQRPVKIAQIRDDAFAPDMARTAGEWAAGSRAGGRVEKVHWLVRSTCMQAFNRSRTRTRDLARLKQHCDPWPAHTDGRTEGQRDSYNCVCRVWSNPSRNRHSQPLLSLSAMDCGPVNLARSLVIRFAFLPECDDEKGRGGVVWVGTQHETGA